MRDPESSTSLPSFDYAALEREARTVVLSRTNEIKSLMRRTAQDLIDIGQKLTEVKEQLEHGNFMNWLKAEFDWSVSAATRFMRVSEQFKFVNLANLNFAPSALYELAAPSTPEKARTEAISRARSGEKITYSLAKALVSQHKKSTKSKRTTSSSGATVEQLEITPIGEVDPPTEANASLELSEPQTIDVSAELIESEEHSRAGIPLESDSSSSEMELADLTQKKASFHSLIRIISIEREEPSSAGDVAQTFEITSTSVRIAVEVTPLAMITLFEQMGDNREFAESVLGQALFLAKSEDFSNERLSGEKLSDLKKAFG